MQTYLRMLLYILALAGLTLSWVSCKAEVQQPQRLNVIWIVLDACRAGNLSCYGYERNTSPNIDALAEQGVLFEKNFAQASYTTLSVPSYMTGRYFPVHGLSTDAWRRLWATPPQEEKLIARLMSDNGYATCMVTSHPWLDERSRIAKSFQEVHFLPTGPEEKRLGYVRLDRLAEKARSWIGEHSDQPYFLYLHAMDTHFPHLLEAPYDQWVPEDVQHTDLAEYKGLKRKSRMDQGDREYLRALHDGSILYSDTVLGEFLDALGGEKLLEKTVVLLCSDHGDALGEDGRTVDHPTDCHADELLHVPLIMAGGGLPKGKRVKALTQNTDIVPTLVDLLGLDSDARFDGKSLSPLVYGNDSPPLHEYSFSKHLHSTDDEDYAIVLRFDDYKIDDDRFSSRKGSVSRTKFWRVPDRLADRQRLSARSIPQRAKELQAVLRAEINPLWKAYNALPRTTPASFELPMTAMQVRSTPAGFVTDRRSRNHRDRRWYAADELVSVRGEDAPPITLETQVPNHSYMVRLQVQCRPARRTANQRAPAFLFKAQQDKEYKKLFAPSRSGKVFLSLGRYEVTDGSFKITLDEGDTGRHLVASRFLFIPVKTGERAPAPEPNPDRAEQLKALGYID